MKKYGAISFLLLISISLCQIRKSRRSKHGEDCVSSAACEEGLVCKINRCFTLYESQHLSLLGLLEKNICNEKIKCKGNLVCYKHRCMDSLLAKEAQKPQPPVNPDDEEDISMVFSGSIYLNKMPYLSGIRPDNTLNYDHLFTHVTNFIKHADISVALQETIFYINPSEKFKPDFTKTPKELGDAIAKAGFNTVLHATQSSYSKLDAGIINTLSYWNNEHRNVTVLGISKTQLAENDYHIYVKNGVRIAIIDFASFLYKALPKGKNYMVNIITKEKVKEIMAKLQDKADFYVACVDWGIKSEKTPTKKQIQTAKLLIENGVNLIIGNHPDYIQPVTYVKSNNGNCGLVFFSLGQFIGDGKNDLGALARVIITKGKNKTYISSYSLFPVINHKVPSNQYTAYRLPQYTQELADLSKKKVKVAKLRAICKKVMGGFAFC
jgi:poly-gamma-glutamate synthesis protein (capsule biosynthesis protein)